VPGRRLGRHPRPEHEALAAARALEGSEAGRRLYAQRRGVAGTLSQAVRAFGLRRARYRSLARTGLQSVATAAALNLDRLAAWFAERPPAPTRVSRFTALAARPAISPTVSERFPGASPGLARTDGSP
jgi:IS5 family transposase